MRITALIAAALVLSASSAALAQDVPTEEARMAAFKANDKNNDGKLDKVEYTALLTQLGFAEMAEQLFTQRDANKDGFVAADEYKTAIQQ